MAKSLLEAGVCIALFGYIPVMVKYVSANVVTIGLFRLGAACLFIAFLRLVNTGLLQISFGG